MRFRIQTAYGDSGMRPTPADVVHYLNWCRRTARLARRGN